MSLQSPKLQGLGAIATIAACLLAFYLAFGQPPAATIPSAQPIAPYREPGAREPVYERTRQDDGAETQTPLTKRRRDEPSAQADDSASVHAQAPLAAEHGSVSVTASGFNGDLGSVVENEVLAALTAAGWNGLSRGGAKHLRIFGTLSETSVTLNHIPTVRASANWEIFSRSGDVQVQGAASARPGTGSDQSTAQYKAIQHLANEIARQIVNKVP